MSAFICSDRQFATVARFFFSADFKAAQHFADHLKRENVRSVNHRYGEKTRFSRVNMAEACDGFTPDDIAAMLACIDYQSCEHPTYNVGPLQLANRLLIATGANREQSTIWSR
jgi:hypothetical protein